MELFFYGTSSINETVLLYRIVLFSGTVPLNRTVLLKRKVLFSGTIPFNWTFLFYGTRYSRLTNSLQGTKIKMARN